MKEIEERGPVFPETPGPGMETEGKLMPSVYLAERIKRRHQNAVKLRFGACVLGKDKIICRTRFWFCSYDGTIFLIMPSG